MSLSAEPIPPANQASFSQVSKALRALQNTVAGVSTPEEVDTEARDRMNALIALLEPHTVAEEHQLFGNLSPDVGRGQTLTPQLELDSLTPLQARGRLTFGRFYLGRNGAVHGGAVPLAFDEVLGRLANTGRSISRTARLEVDFRSITPFDRELTFRGDVVEIDGRKRWLTGQLHDGETLCAEARGLFVALRPGQP